MEDLLRQFEYKEQLWTQPAAAVKACESGAVTSRADAALVKHGGEDVRAQPTQSSHVSHSPREDTIIAATFIISANLCVGVSNIINPKIGA